LHTQVKKTEIQIEQPRNRPRSTAELETQFAQSVGELRLALDRMAQLDPAAVRPLAGELRLLVGNGEGNRLLFRIAAKRGLALAPVYRPNTSDWPDRSEPGRRLLRSTTYASIHHQSESPHPDNIAEQLDEALDRLVYARLENGERREMTWRDCVHAVADKLSLHADSEQPILLDQLDAFFSYNGIQWGYRFALERLGRVVAAVAKFELGTVS